MIYDMCIGVSVTKSKVSCISAGTERNYLFRRSRRGGEEAVDEKVDGGGADIRSYILLLEG
jgi:hypothetical protein